MEGKINSSEFLDYLEKHKGIIIKISKIYKKNEEDRKDLSQEIMYNLWNSINSFLSKPKLSTWIYNVGLKTARIYCT